MVTERPNIVEICVTLCSVFSRVCYTEFHKVHTESHNGTNENVL